MNTAEQNKLKEALINLREFLDVDLPSKIFPEEEIDGETWIRQDYFKSEQDVRDYIKAHLDVFEEEIK